jgi:lysophospholipid acyltransferase (LPLAT)-like uncharacterized protein
MMLDTEDAYKNNAQALVDEAKPHIVALYHLSQKLHALACQGQKPEEVILTGELMRMVSALKDRSLGLNNMFGGITAKSGGT